LPSAISFAAIEAGRVLLPERDLNYVNAYGPVRK